MKKIKGKRTSIFAGVVQQKAALNKGGELPRYAGNGFIAIYDNVGNNWVLIDVRNCENYQKCKNSNFCPCRDMRRGASKRVERSRANAIWATGNPKTEKK